MNATLPPPLLILLDASAVPSGSQAHKAISKAAVSWAGDVVLIERHHQDKEAQHLGELIDSSVKLVSLPPSLVSHLDQRSAVLSAFEDGVTPLDRRLICIKGSLDNPDSLESIKADLVERGASMVHADGTDLYGAPFMSSEERTGARPGIFDRIAAQTIDLISTVSGRCLYAGTSVEELSTKRKGLDILPIETIAELEVAAARSKPTLCAAHSFQSALECMPPANVGSFEGIEIFQLEETYKAGVTGTFARDGDRYFTWRAPLGLSHRTLVGELRDSVAWQQQAGTAPVMAQG